MFLLFVRICVVVMIERRQCLFMQKPCTS